MMLNKKLFLLKVELSVSFLLYSFSPFIPSTQAQVVPDNTLPENSVVNSDCADSCLIEGGTTMDNNLFHSFERLSIPTNGEAVFNNNLQIENIFTRVTGSSISHIDGVIRAQGNANLFLINPNGIIFGNDAQLDIGGSFLATTADSILFADENQFSAVNPQSSPLLTVSVPIGLQFGEIPGKIVNQSQFAIESTNPLIPFPKTVGLKVKDSKTLALVGGEIVLNNGLLTASEGRIEIGSVAANSFVALSQNSNDLILNYKSVNQFAKIFIINESGITVNNSDTSTEFPSGVIQIYGSHVKLDNLSSIESFNASKFKGGKISINADFFSLQDARVTTNTFGEGEAGDIEINANSLNLNGEQHSNVNIVVGISAQADEDSSGDSGNITINTNQLTIQNGAQVSVSTFGLGDAGNLTVNASESIEVIGRASDGESSSGLFSQSLDSEATGDAGNLQINTERLIVRDGGRISVGAIERSEGISQGDGGNIEINATESVLVDGFGRDEQGNIVPSTLLSESQGIGNAGNLIISTPRLTLANGGEIAVSTLNSGAGGELDITARQFNVSNGGTVTAETSGEGNAGNIFLQVSDNITLTGDSSGLFANTANDSTGRGGNIVTRDRTPQTISVSDGAAISVDSDGEGQGGNINLAAGQLNLNNGAITAETQSTQGGNITFNIAENLELRNDAEITATAGTAQAGGDGGNVILHSDFILAFPTANQHQITAEAFTGDGGSINIRTNNILGADNLKISASSDSGIDGTISVETPDVDTTSGIIELPTVPIDAETIFAQDLCKFEDDQIAKGSSFIITGRGGLTPTSEDSIGNVGNVVGWANREDIEVSENGTVGVRQRSEEETETNNYPVVQQSQGWVTTADGSVWLVANSPETIPQNTGLTHPDCGNSTPSPID